MIDQHFPKGWNEKHVVELLAELNARSEEEWLAADEAAASEDEQAKFIDPSSCPKPRPCV